MTARKSRLNSSIKLNYRISAFELAFYFQRADFSFLLNVEIHLVLQFQPAEITLHPRARLLASIYFRIHPGSCLRQGTS